MGLYVTAYSRARFTASWPESGDYDDSVHVAISPGMLKDFPARADGLQPGLYTAVEAASTLSIGYSGWSVWRAQVASIVLCKQVGAWDEWALKEAESGPLGRLLYFTDRYGVLGAVTCARLVAEMAEVRVRFESAYPDGGQISYSELNSLGVYDRVAALLTHAVDEGFALFK